MYVCDTWRTDDKNWRWKTRSGREPDVGISPRWTFFGGDSFWYMSTFVWVFYSGIYQQQRRGTLVFWRMIMVGCKVRDEIVLQSLVHAVGNCRSGLCMRIIFECVSSRGFDGSIGLETVFRVNSFVEEEMAVISL